MLPRFKSRICWPAAILGPCSPDLRDAGLLGQADIRTVEVRAGEEHPLAKLARGGAWRNHAEVGCASARDQAGWKVEHLAVRQLVGTQHALKLAGGNPIQDHAGI